MKKKKIMAVFCFLLIVTLITGCGQKEDKTQPVSDTEGSAQTAGAEEGNSEAAGAEAYRKALEFMIREYGFTAEELLGIDVEAIIKDYCLDEMEYTREEVLEILDEQGDYYKLDPAADTFSILGVPDDVPAAGADLTVDADIVQIGYYVNNGSLQKKMMFDLEDGIYYVGEAIPYNITDEQISALKKIPLEAGIPFWEHRYESNDEKETTGSYRWKMVFALRDGTKCVYGGYTRDMSNFPEGYSVAHKAFINAEENVSIP